LEIIVNIFFYIAFLGAFPFIATIYFLNNSHTNNIYPVLFILITYFLALALIYALLNNRKLKRVNGENENFTREICKKALVDSDWIICTNNKNILIGTKSWGWTSLDWGKEIVVIFDKKDILINSVAYGRYGTVSPFHWFANRNREKMIIKKILEECTTNR